MQCLAAAEELAKEGISAEVIDLRTLLPLDYDRILASVEKTGRALVVHAATEFCGLGAEIASTINEATVPQAEGAGLAVRCGLRADRLFQNHRNRADTARRHHRRAGSRTFEIAS